jgi:hypothetical protein
MDKQFLIDEYKNLESEIKDLQYIKRLIEKSDPSNEKIERLHQKINELIFKQAEVLKEV